jgi:hypothetical protein
MNTISLSPAIVRALFEGIHSLNDGDLKDRSTVKEVLNTLAAGGVTISCCGDLIPLSEITEGYIAHNGGSSWVFCNGHGEWLTYDASLPPNVVSTIFFDEDRKVPAIHATVSHHPMARRMDHLR